MIEIDTSGLQKFRLNLGNVKVDEAIKAALKEAVLTALRSTKERTHVVTGNLRREWKITDIEKDGDKWVITLYNDAKYAPYVEYGHRTRINKDTGIRKGWVPGQYMMKISCDEVSRNMGKIVQKQIDNMYKQMGFK